MAIETAKKTPGTYGENFGTDFQWHLLAVAARHPSGLIRYRTAFDHTYFTSDPQRVIAKALLAHIDKYKAVPTKTLLVEEAKLYASKELAEKLDKFVAQMYVDDVSDATAVLDKAVEFGKIQAMCNAMLAGAEQIDKGDRSGVLELVQKAQHVGEDILDLGIEFNTADRLNWYGADAENDRVPTGLSHLDRALGGGSVRGGLYVILAPPKRGKSLDRNARLWNREKGYVCMGELVDAFDAALEWRFPLVGVSQVNNQVKPTTVTDVLRSGVKPVCDIHLRSGRIISGFADTHPVLTWNGYVASKDLKVGDFTVGISKLPLTGACGALDAERCYVVGVFLGDGGLTGDSPRLFLHKDELEVFHAVCSVMYSAKVPVVCPRSENGITMVFQKEVFDFLEKYGVDRCLSKHKRVPRRIYELGERAVAACLAGLFDTDGSSYLTGKGGRSRAEYSTASYALSEDYLTMLNVLGVYAKRRKKMVKLVGGIFPAWIVYLDDAESLELFYEKVAPHGHNKKKWDKLAKRRIPLDATKRGQFYKRLPWHALERVADKLRGATRWSDASVGRMWRKLTYGTNSRKASYMLNRAVSRRSRVGLENARVMADYVADDFIRQMASGDFVFDEITEITWRSPEECYDITVDADTQSFVAEHVFTHNTTALINIGFGTLLYPDAYNVVHITTEISAKRVAMRYDARLSGKDFKYRKSDPVKYAQIMSDRASKFLKGRLFIRGWPTRTCTPSNIRSYLSQLAGHGVRVDRLIVDYADIMKAERRIGDMRHEQAGIYEDLRGIGGEYDCDVWTGSQATKAALEKETPDMGDFAEAFEKGAVMDGGFAFAQTPDEAIEGRARLFAMGLRDEQDRSTVTLQIDRARCWIRTTGLYDQALMRIQTPEDDPEAIENMQFPPISKPKEDDAKGAWKGKGKKGDAKPFKKVVGPPTTPIVAPVSAPTPIVVKKPVLSVPSKKIVVPKPAVV